MEKMIDMKTREVKKIIVGNPQMDGAGVKLVRVLGTRDIQDFDPFLMFDAFDSKNPADYIKGFPWHPHRGIETVTYLIDGKFEHGDSLGNRGVIEAGDCQWMTAGSGIIHQEMPQPSDRMLGAQLWINLPQKDKMTHPKYHDIRAKDIPVVKTENAEIKIIAGEYKGNKGAFHGEFVDATYLDVSLNKNSEITIDTKEGETAFVYIFEGNGYFGSDEKKVMAKNIALFTDGDKLQIKTVESDLRLILLMGKPLKETVAWGGPVVMNTREELNTAFEELDEGTFIKH